MLSFTQAVFTFAARLMHSSAPTVQQRLADAAGHSEAEANTPAQSSTSGAAKPASLADVVSPWAPSGTGVNLPDASEWLYTGAMADGWLCRGRSVPIQWLCTVSAHAQAPQCTMRHCRAGHGDSNACECGHHLL